jgi:hypothetical protein
MFMPGLLTRAEPIHEHVVLFFVLHKQPSFLGGFLQSDPFPKYIDVKIK